MQLPSIPDWLHEELLKWAGKIILFLNNLTSDVPHPKGGVQKAAMPTSAFKTVKALSFVFRRKWACLVSYQQDIGFLTRKITGPDGITWSSPYFMIGRSFGVGFTIGSLKSGICLALMNDEAVKSYSKKKYIMTVNGQFLVDMDGARIRPTKIDSTNVDDNVIGDGNSGAMLAKYFRMEAMMIDFSVGGGTVGPWKSRNKYLYGTNEFDKVWEDKVETPSELIPVLDVLKRYAQEASKPKIQKSRSRSGKEGGQFVLKHSLSSASAAVSDLSA